jgi:hypothetical protein
MAADRVLYDIVIFLFTDQIPDAVQGIDGVSAAAFEIAAVFFIASHNAQIVAEGRDGQVPDVDGDMDLFKDQTDIKADHTDPKGVVRNGHALMMGLSEGPLKLAGAQDISPVFVKKASHLKGHGISSKGDRKRLCRNRQCPSVMRCALPIIDAAKRSFKNHILKFPGTFREDFMGRILKGWTVRRVLSAGPASAAGLQLTTMEERTGERVIK